MNHGKRYTAAREKAARDVRHPLMNAVGLVKEAAPALFKEAGQFDRAAEVHPRGQGIFRSGGLYDDPVSVISVALAFICGTAGLPHILMRFFTVPDAQQARRSIGYAVVFIGYFQAAIFIIGIAAIALLSGETEYVDESGRIAGGANMVAVYLSRLVGGEVFFGFISAVAFATILAVVAGIVLVVVVNMN